MKSHYPRKLHRCIKYTDHTLTAAYLKKGLRRAATLGCPQIRRIIMRDCGDSSCAPCAQIASEYRVEWAPEEGAGAGRGGLDERDPLTFYCQLAFSP